MNSLGKVFCALIFVLTMHSAKAATELAPGVLYAGGAQLKVSVLGVEFTVPKNWQALLPQGAEVLFMEPENAVARIIISAVPDSTETDIRQQLMQSQDLDMHTKLIPVGKPDKKGDTFSQQYRFEGFNSQQLAAKAFARIGKNKTAFVLMILEPEADPKFTQMAKKLVQLVRFTQPVQPATQATNKSGNINWEQELKGRTLKYMNTSNGLSVTKLMNLCSDYSFSYSDNDSYVSSNAISDFSASNQTGNSGRWHIEGNQLTLQWSDGSVSRFSLSRRYVEEWDEWGTFVDENRWFNLTNNVCT